MFPSDNTARAYIADCGADSIEIVCRARPDSAEGLRWIMARGDAEDLVDWWRAEDVRVKNGQRSVRDKAWGNVLVSMFSPSVVHVRVRDRFGNIKVVGYCFPRTVMEELDRWLSGRAAGAPAARRRG